LQLEESSDDGDAVGRTEHDGGRVTTGERTIEATALTASPVDITPIDTTTPRALLVRSSRRARGWTSAPALSVQTVSSVEYASPHSPSRSPTSWGMIA
jgi:hypothetical protein